MPSWAVGLGISIPFVQAKEVMMNYRRGIVRRTPDGRYEEWVPTTLDAIGKTEEYLEAALAEVPGLLRLETLRSGIRGPYAVFRQLSFQTPQERAIQPDITLLTSSGHFVVVEVKRFVNPELRDRRVIAQIVDYASAFASLRHEDLLSAFTPVEGARNWTWPDFVANCFPGFPESGELAEELASKVHSGRIHLVIACDKAPHGLDEVVRGIATQNALGFDLELLEVTPYVRSPNEPDDVLFVPRVRLKTEIVARTAITVTYQEGQARPAVEVKTTSLEEIEEGIRLAETGQSRAGRVWSEQEIEEAVRQDGDPTLRALLEFARQHSAGGQVVAPGRKVSPTFGFYVETEKDDGHAQRYMLFRCTAGWNMMTIYLATPRDLGGEKLGAEFAERLGSIFGPSAIGDKKEPWIELEEVSRHLEEFKNTVLWVQGALRQR